jgi:hypothetical protein
VIVYFRFVVRNASTTWPLNVTGADTFAADSWSWATSKGKNLLRMPLDFRVLSLGLLTIHAAQMDIAVAVESAECLRRVDYALAVDVLARFLADNVTGNGSMLTPDGPVVCRSAFAFSHRLFQQRGIGAFLFTELCRVLVDTTCDDAGLN